MNDDLLTQVKEWSEDASKFIQRHPLAAVAGALAIGYLLGSVTTRRRNY